LTAEAANRFAFSRNGGPRHLHSYGTVLVGGTGAEHGLRIAETAHGAFHINGPWLVEFEIVTPGFEWSRRVLDTPTTVTDGFHTRTRHGGAATNGVGGQGVGTVSIHSRELSPTAVTAANRNRTFSYIMEFSDAATPFRLVNDWVNFRMDCSKRSCP
jgi:hypothetical protein